VLAMLDKGTPGATYAPAGSGLVVPEAVATRVVELAARHGGRPGSLTVPASRGRLVVADEPYAGRLAQDTGWRAEETAETALSKTVRWYLSNEVWWRPLAAAQAADAKRLAELVVVRAVQAVQTVRPFQR